MTQLSKLVGKRVRIRIKDGQEITGTLKETDQYMNMVLSDAVEVDGQEKISWGSLVIRGSFVLFVVDESKLL